MELGRVQNAAGQVIGADHDGGPDFEVQEDGGKKMIRHRQDPEHPVAGGESQSLVGAMRPLQDTLMRQNHALGRAGRAGSEPQEGGAFDPWRQRRRRYGQPRKPQGCAVRQFQIAALAGRRGGAAVVENRAQRRARQHLRHFVRFEQVMDGHDDRAAAQGGQAADDERASVAAAHAHALSAAHAQPFELDPEGFDFAPERLVIQRAGGINDRDLFGPLARGLEKGFVNVHAFESQS